MQPNALSPAPPPVGKPDQTGKTLPKSLASLALLAARAWPAKSRAWVLSAEQREEKNALVTTSMQAANPATWHGKLNGSEAIRKNTNWVCLQQRQPGLTKGFGKTQILKDEGSVD